MRTQKITPFAAALAQADRLSLLLHQAASRGTGATPEETEAIAALASVLTAVLKKVAPVPRHDPKETPVRAEGVREARAAVTAAMRFMERDDAVFTMRWMMFTKQLLTEALGEGWNYEAENWLRRQLDGLSG